jgi:lycopene beta-cyclase
MERYDYIFAGAGCAALSLVFHLNRSVLRTKRILLIDPLINQVPTKTWCYWAEKPLLIHPKNSNHSWNTLNLKIEGNLYRKYLGNLRYFHINSKDFYSFVLEELKKSDTIFFKEATINEISENNSSGVVTTLEGDQYFGGTIFDSRFIPSKLVAQPYLKQVFAGWTVETIEPLFDPTIFTLMDIQKNSESQFEFLYILPFSPTSALIEVTVYSQENIDNEILEKKLKKYLTKYLKTNEYKVSFQEIGVIPMTNKRLHTKPSSRIFPIGTAAGWTKASSGYTFQRIQENSSRIVSNIEKGLPPLKGINRKARYEFYDNILLNIAIKWPEKLSALFADLFQKNPPERVLMFLSEETSLLDEIKLLGKLNYAIFIKSLLKYESH